MAKNLLGHMLKPTKEEKAMEHQLEELGKLHEYTNYISKVLSNVSSNST